VFWIVKSGAVKGYIKCYGRRLSWRRVSVTVFGLKVKHAWWH